jgi:hypothetical protein
MNVRWRHGLRLLALFLLLLLHKRYVAERLFEYFHHFKDFTRCKQLVKYSFDFCMNTRTLRDHFCCK